MTPSLYGTMKDDISYMYSQSLLNLKALEEWPVHPFKIGYLDKIIQKKKKEEERVESLAPVTKHRCKTFEKREGEGMDDQRNITATVTPSLHGTMKDDVSYSHS